MGVGVFDILNTKCWEIVQKAESLRKEQYGEEYNQIPQLELEFMESHFGAEGGKVSESDPVEYFNSTGLMWGKVREALKAGTLQIPDDEQLIKQLSNRCYRVEDNGSIRLERKEDMKKRGVPSPDIADALALALYTPEEPAVLPFDSGLSKESY